jgi:hypothetical protein
VITEIHAAGSHGRPVDCNQNDHSRSFLNRLAAAACQVLDAANARPVRRQRLGCWSDQAKNVSLPLTFLVAPLGCVCINWPEATTDKLDRYKRIGVISAAHLDPTSHRVG